MAGKKSTKKLKQAKKLKSTKTLTQVGQKIEW
jgi:hypothetical protein